MNRASKRLIGAFVLGAFLLVIGAITMFGSQDLFQEKRRFVAYFEQSVNGLNVGAPIKFRGIEIGQVTSIEGVFDPETNRLIPRLELEIHPETMRNAQLEDGEYNLFRPLVEQGMRGSLKSQSLLTGQLYVSLDFYEDRPVRRLGNDDDPYPEMPTVESGFGEFVASLQQIPIDQIFGQLSSTLASLDEVLSGDDMGRTLDELPQLLASLDRTVRSVGEFTSTDLPQTTAQFRSFLATGESSMTAFSDQLTNGTLADIGTTLSEIDATLAATRQRLDRDDPVSQEITATLRDVSDAAVAMRRLAEFIEAHPEAIIGGREE